MEEKRDVMLFICPDCELLLMKIDFKFVQYPRGEVDENGEYISDDWGSESFFDYYLCPLCENTTSEVEDQKNSQLKSVTVAHKDFILLKNLWEELRKNEDIEGIPLDNPLLKEILVEALI